MCKETKAVVQEILREKETVKLCSDPCFSAFKFVKHFDVLIPKIHIYYDGLSKMFCSKPCKNVFVMLKRKIVLGKLMILDKKGLLTDLRGMEHKLVTCHIVGADCAVQAVRKIGAWPVQSITSLATIFRKFQCLQTLDGQKIAKRQSRKIMSGSIIEVPKILLKKISKVDSEYFQEKAVLVVEKKISLHFLVEEFFKIPKRQLTTACIMEISGFKAFESLKMMFPGKFSEVLDKNGGAVVGVKENYVGADLKNNLSKSYRGQR